ncbi:MAG: YceI family protein [Actinomycetota bacterium]
MTTHRSELLAARHLPARQPNRWVKLDRSWAQQLSVHRDRGVYRIRRRDLLKRLANNLEPVRPVEPQWISRHWAIDPAHTTVGFVAPHLMVAKVRGGFKQVSGSVFVGTCPSEAQVDVTVETASIDTGEPVRDAHLRSGEFLDVDNHPHMRFVSTGLEIRGPRNCRLCGDLTIRGVTRPVSLELEYLGTVTDALGQPRMAFEARSRIDREEFGLVWNRVLESGGVLVGRQIELQIEAQALPAPV